MEPSEFCRKWVTSLKPDNWGYRQACIQVLTEATGLSESTINSWGKNFERRPDHILHILDKDDFIRRFEKPVPKISDRTLTDIGPWEYCVYWIDSKEPGQRGFRNECIRELEKATLGYYKSNTIKKWGYKFERCPETALYLIKSYHYHKLMQQMLCTMTIPDNPYDRNIYEQILSYVNFLMKRWHKSQ